jgi:tetratricopeptide (TPR) repeat protein
MKPVFVFIVGFAGLLMVLKRESFTGNSIANGLVLLGLLWLVLQYYFGWGNVFPYIFLLALFLLFKVFYGFLVKDNCINNRVLIVIYGVMISIEIVLVLASKNFQFLRFYPNDSIFSILLAGQLLFVIPYLKRFYKVKSSNKIFPYIFIVFCYFILFYTKGRAGILGFTVGLLFLNYHFLKSKISILIIGVAAFCLMLALINVKSDSSNGRLLIYKVVYDKLEPKEVIFGIGYGNFRTKYNQFQAAYFSKHSINSDEALLAGNTIYMYNDSLQLVIEIGLLGLAILIVGTILFFRYLRRDYLLFDEKPLLFGAYLSIVCIVVSSFFSFPFQMIGILIHFVFCIAVIVSFYQHQSSKQPFLNENKYQVIGKITLLVISICLLFFGYQSFVFYQKANETVLLSKAGFRKKAINNYSELYNDFIKDGDLMHNYAEELTKVNQLDSAIIVLNETMKYRYDDKCVLLMGNLLLEKKQFSEAEKQFIQAVSLNPKLFRNRQVLFQFYYETKQWNKALYWGNSILKLKVKIPSKTVENIKIETKKRLIEIQTLEDINP